MRFLFINQYYLPDFAATAQQMADLCETLVANGHEVHVLCGNRLYDGRDLRLEPAETVNGVHVHRVPITAGSRKRFRDRIREYLSFYWRAFIEVHRLERPDVVVTLTSPPMISLLGTWLRIVRRSRFVYWVMDIYPDIAHKAGLLGSTSIVRRTWALLGRVSYLTANRIVVLGDDMKSVLIRKGVPEKRFEVFSSWSCGELIRPLPPEENAFRRRHVDPDAFTLMYSGNMGFCHTFRAVIEGIETLSGDGRFRFLFVGSGQREGELRAKLSACRRTTEFLPYQKRESLAESLSAPSAQLITLDPRFDGLLVPSKLYGIMAAGQAMIYVGSENNTIAKVLREAQCGIRVDPESTADFVAAVRRLADDPAECARLGANGREWFERNCDRESVTAELARFLYEVGVEDGLRNRSLAHEAPMAARVRDSGAAAAHLD